MSSDHDSIPAIRGILLALTIFAVAQAQNGELLSVEGSGALLQVKAARKAPIVTTPEEDCRPRSVELMRGHESTGLKMPLIGLGAAQALSGVQESIVTFLEHGGQLIDTAILYGQVPVGEALKTAMEKGITRDDIWVTSKILPQAANTSQQTLALVNQSLQELGLTFIDLFLIHWPGDSNEQIWKGLIQARDAGKLRAIGVSNFSPEQILELETLSGERPSVNQFQYHPWVDDAVHENVRWCRDNGVAVTAYGSLGGQYHDGLNDPSVLAVAAKHNATPAQVLLRWALYQGVTVIPGASSLEHILEDLNVFILELDVEERSPTYFRK